MISHTMISTLLKTRIDTKSELAIQPRTETVQLDDRMFALVAGSEQERAQRYEPAQQNAPGSPGSDLSRDHHPYVPSRRTSCARTRHSQPSLLVRSSLGEQRHAASPADRVPRAGYRDRYHLNTVVSYAHRPKDGFLLRKKRPRNSSSTGLDMTSLNRDDGQRAAYSQQTKDGLAGKDLTFGEWRLLAEVRRDRTRMRSLWDQTLVATDLDAVHRSAVEAETQCPAAVDRRCGTSIDVGVRQGPP